MDFISSQIEEKTGILSVMLKADLVSNTVLAGGNSIETLLSQCDFTSQAWDSMRIDLSKVNMMDSRGLKLVVSLLKHAETRNADIEILVSNSHIERALNFSGITSSAKVTRLP